jgi:hypothetical protein
MSVFNPYVLLGLVLAILGSFGGGYYKGKKDENTRQQIEIAAANEKARQTEQNMAAVANTYATTLRNAQNAARAKETKLRADAATGALRLSIPTQAPVCPAPNATPAAGDSREARAELDRSTAEALISIAADGDAAIRKLNACITLYNETREALKGKP